jgi:hypothetical protein
MRISASRSSDLPTEPLFLLTAAGPEINNRRPEDRVLQTLTE